MTVKACNVRIYVDKYDLTAKSNVLTIDNNIGVLEYSVFGDCSVLKLPNVSEMMVEHGGFFTTPDAGELEKEIYDSLGDTSDVVSAFIVGTHYDTPIAYVLDDSFSATLRLNAQTNQLLTVNGNWKNKTTKYRGYEVYRGTISSTGAQTQDDFGAAGNTGKAYLFVQTITGTATSAAIKVQGDSDAGFSSPVDLGTFTFSATGVQELTFNSTVHRYIRINCTSLGGATSFLVACVVCSSGVTF